MFHSSKGIHCAVVPSGRRKWWGASGVQPFIEVGCPPLPLPFLPLPLAPFLAVRPLGARVEDTGTPAPLLAPAPSPFLAPVPAPVVQEFVRCLKNSGW